MAIPHVVVQDDLALSEPVKEATFLFPSFVVCDSVKRVSGVEMRLEIGYEVNFVRVPFFVRAHPKHQSLLIWPGGSRVFSEGFPFMVTGTWKRGA